MNNRLLGSAAKMALVAGSLAGCAPSEAPMLAEITPENKDVFTAEWLDDSDGRGEAFQDTQSNGVVLVTEALNQARVVADLTQNQEALELAAFAEKYAKPSIVTSLGPVALSGTHVEQADGDFFVVGISDDDKDVSVVGEALMRVPSDIRAMYTEELNTLTFYEDRPLSGLWLGILTQHELHHAQRHEEGASDLNNEAAARMYEQTLVEEVFGEPYLTVVGKMVEEMRDDFIFSLENPNSTYELPDIDVSSLMDSESLATEENFIITVVAIGAAFRLTEEIREDPTVEDMQAAYAAAIRSGKLPSGG